MITTIQAYAFLHPLIAVSFYITLSFVIAIVTGMLVYKSNGGSRTENDLPVLLIAVVWPIALVVLLFGGAGWLITNANRLVEALTSFLGKQILKKGK
jgi:hypothetical protein